MANTRPGEPITLTFGQTLLWLLKRGVLSATVDLECLYLVGPDLVEADLKEYILLRDHIDQLLRHHSQERFILGDRNHFSLTSEDPVRRYFETHLAWHTMRHGLGNLSKTTLTELRAALHAYSNHAYEMFLGLFFDEKPPINLLHVNGILQEYGHIYQKIQGGVKPFNELLPSEKEQLLLIIECMTLSFLITQDQNKHLPIMIQDLGYYEDCHRGREPRDTRMTQITRGKQVHSNIPQTTHYGLVRPNAPLASTDLAQMSEINRFSKPSERYTFDPHAAFPRFLFSKAVHPFSTSLSGTMLFLLRVFKRLEERSLFAFEDTATFASWIQSLTGLMLFHSGGHSLFEFMTVFEFTAVQEAFEFIPHFDRINLQTVFHTWNSLAFRQALEETFAYQASYLNRLALNQEVNLSAQSRIRDNIHSCLEAVKAYSGSNKKSLVQGFKMELSVNLPDEHSLANWEKSLGAIKGILRRLKHADQMYYEQFSFFKSFRQQHSSLAVCIQNAEKELERIHPAKKSK